MILKFKKGLMVLGVTMGLVMPMMMDSSAAIANDVHPVGPTQSFQSIPQPLILRVFVTFGCVALIGTELWWFLQKNQTH